MLSGKLRKGDSNETGSRILLAGLAGLAGVAAAVAALRLSGNPSSNAISGGVGSSGTLGAKSMS
jgi:hypothetical protein